MSGLFPVTPPTRGEGDETTFVEPEQRRDVARRWALRAAQWRATALAEWAFEGRVRPQLIGRGEAAGFRGLLELEVPFRDLARHREAEARFLAAAGHDEHLARTPLVIVFTPRQVERGGAGR